MNHTLNQTYFVLTLITISFSCYHIQSLSPKTTLPLYMFELLVLLLWPSIVCSVLIQLRLSLLQEAWSPGARPRDFLDSVIRYRSSFLFRVRGWRSGVKPSLLLPSWWVLHCTQVCGCCRCVPPRLDAVGVRRSSVVAPWPA